MFPAIETEQDQVAIKPDQSVKLLLQVPIQRDVVAKPLPLEEFLPLKDHGDARRSKDQAGGQGGTFLRIPARGVLGIDLLRDAGLAVGNLVVRLAVDHPIEGILPIAKCDGPADRLHGALCILRKKFEMK